MKKPPQNYFCGGFSEAQGVQNILGEALRLPLNAGEGQGLPGAVLL